MAKPKSPPPRLRIAAIQMQSTPDVSANLAQARALIEEAADRRADWVCLPENFAVFTENPRAFLKAAESVPPTSKDLVIPTLQEWAVELGVWIAAGSHPVRGGKRPTNTSLLIDPDGAIRARYEKIHLFDADVGPDGTAARRYRESSLTRAGEQPVCFRSPWGPVGFSICYDVRFPELYRRFALQDARMLMIPAAFTAATGKAHWDVLTRARAIENQAYVVCATQWGSPYPGRESHGHARIIDPWGRVIAERPAGLGVVIAELDFEKQDQIRAELPALRHARKGLSQIFRPTRGH